MPSPTLDRAGTGPLLVTAVVLLGLVAALAAVAAGRWSHPGLEELDLGAAGAGAADGTWQGEEVVVDRERLALDVAPVLLDVDTVAARLDGTGGCNRLLGSFTFDPDGRASVSVPNARPGTCEPAVMAREAAVVRALEGADRWEVVDGRLVLDGPTTRLVLHPA